MGLSVGLGGLAAAGLGSSTICAAHQQAQARQPAVEPLGLLAFGEQFLRSAGYERLLGLQAKKSFPDPVIVKNKNLMPGTWKLSFREELQIETNKWLKDISE